MLATSARLLRLLSVLQARPSWTADDPPEVRAALRRHAEALAARNR